MLNLQAIGLEPSPGSGLSKNVQDGPNKIFVGGLPYHLTDKQVLEVLETFGPLKAFHLVRDSQNPAVSKGYAFCEYFDPNLTSFVVDKLHGLAIGEGKSLTVKIASGSDNGRGGGAASVVPAPAAIGSRHPPTSGPGVGMPPAMQGTMVSVPMHGGMGMGMGGMMGMGMGMGAPPPPNPYPVGYGIGPTGAQPYPAAPLPIAVAPHVPTVNSKVLRLANMVTSMELQDDQEYMDIKQDVWEECSQYGKLVHIVIPRAKEGFPKAAEGLIFVEFETPYGAAQASRALMGRRFSDRLVEVMFFDENLYSRKIYT